MLKCFKQLKVNTLLPLLSLFKRFFARNAAACIVIILSGATSISFAENIKSVHGKFSYIINDDENITLKEAKNRSIEHAKAEAIKAEFGEEVYSDYITTTIEKTDESYTSVVLDTEVRAKGEWLVDEREPVINLEYQNGNFVFNVEVWGKAREITRSTTQIDWAIQTDRNGLRTEVDEFMSGERIYVNFTSPADGYVVIYLIGEDGSTSCLLPYRNDTSGRFKVHGGKSYTFFDKKEDEKASQYKLKTTQPEESNQIVVIYSPNPFVKCRDASAEGFEPNSVTTSGFRNWLLKCQRSDKDMVVAKKRIRILKN